MKLVFAPRGWEDYLHWQRNDQAVLTKVNALIEDAMRRPHTGLGKPEPLRNELAGWWSRRITGEHRLIYAVAGRDDEQRLTIAQCRHHY